MRLFPTSTAALLPLFLTPSILSTQLHAQKSLRILQVGSAQLDAKQQLKNLSFVLRAGKIQEFGRQANPSQGSRLSAEKRWSFPKGFATAGFVDIHSSLGAKNELAEQVVSFFPDFDAADAYDPADPAWKLLARCGVTSLVLAPSNTSLVGGLAAFLRPGQSERPAASYMKFSFTRSMLNREREPTSLLGASDLLKRKIERLQAPSVGAPRKLSPGMARFAQVLSGKQSVGIACQTRAEILQAIRLIKTHRLNAFLLHVDEAEFVLDQLAKSQLSVVLRPLSLQSSARKRKLPQLLAAKGIPFAFAGEESTRMDLPQLQCTLALLVQAGIDPMRAIASVTSVPARLAGLDKQVGSLLRGRDADIVVWSHPPTELRARPLLVLRRGEVLYEASPTPKTSKKGAKL
ncbi:MAG: hypothetical protein CSA62_11965 [Planctomycetota bacterium]|nr:MAG: hypothetical protein CSA62_11965 [Planctomycetota bacterium]